jgi:hypothetical protein
MELVAGATVIGILYPLIFLAGNLPNARFAYLVGALLIIGGLLLLIVFFTRGRLFVRHPSEGLIRGIILGWGTIMLLITGWLILVTGGIGGSIFTWLFQYVLVITVAIRPSGTGRSEWAAVWLTAAIEIVIVVLLMLGAYYLPQPSFTVRRVPIWFWAGLSLIYAISLSVIMFMLSRERLQRQAEAINATSHSNP